jgi:hypothetical protein
MARFFLGSVVAILLSSTLAWAEEVEATLTKVDLERKLVVVDRGSKYQAFSIAKVILLDKNGGALKLSDLPKYEKGARVQITLEKAKKDIILTQLKFLSDKKP